MTMTVKERIVWVCAGRSEGDLEEALKSRGAVWVFPDGLPPLDEQATRAMLIEHLGRLKYALFERDEGERNRFVEAVTRKSEGLPLYVRMVIEDLKVRRWTVWDEDKLPPGLVAYYEWLLEQLGVSDVGAVLTPLFCLLAWAKEPVTEGTMKFLLQTYPLADTPRWGELFQRALEHGHLMLQQRPTSDGESGWAIYHDSFRQHLLESGTVSNNREWAQERWLKVCKDWKALASQEPSLHRYILRHYAEHLHERWQSPAPDAQSLYSELCRLALDPEFAQAQTQYLPDEPNLPLKTVQLALKSAIQLEDAPMMARLLMEHAKRVLSEETPLQAWRRGHRERALRMATEIVFEQDRKLGTLWSLLLAWVAESEGERDWAKRFLDEVRKRWEGAKLAKLDDWQGEMAVFLLGELGQIEGAIEVAGSVLDDESKRKLAASLASKELFEQALKVAEGIERAYERAEALSAIAVEMAKAGMFDQALKVAKEIEGRAWALRTIAEEMAEAGLFERALQVAEGIKDAWWRARALTAIAEGLAKAGMRNWAKEVFNQALQVAEGIKWADERAWVLGAIAEGMGKAGVEDEALWRNALQVVKRIEGARERVEALVVIAEGMEKAGMRNWAGEVFNQALQVAERIEGARERAEALVAIAEGMEKAGMENWAEEVFNQALQVAEGIWGAEERAEALGAIAEGMVKAGVQDEALWRKALQVAEGIERERERARALGAIAEGMARAGLFERALQVAEGIEDAWWRAEALRAIAEEMAKAGEVEGAVGIVEREMAVRTERLPFILSALAERAREGDGRSKEGFLRLLPLCGWSLGLAYEACGWLALLYPERREEIAKVVSGE
jgi:hypothetical protein